MNIKKKSQAIKELDKIRKKPLDFSDLLHSVRTTSEMSQVELATKAKTTKAKICDFEKGRRVPTLELAAKLAKALGHSEELFVSKIIKEQLKRSGLQLKIEIKAA